MKRVVPGQSAKLTLTVQQIKRSYRGRETWVDGT